MLPNTFVKRSAYSHERLLNCPTVYTLKANCHTAPQSFEFGHDRQSTFLHNTPEFSGHQMPHCFIRNYWSNYMETAFIGRTGCIISLAIGQNNHTYAKNLTYTCQILFNFGGNCKEEQEEALEITENASKTLARSKHLW